MVDVLVENKIEYSYLPQLVGHMAGLAHLQAVRTWDELNTIGLTPKQFVALEFISNNLEVSQRQIAEHIGTTPTVIVGILDVLTELGLVRRVQSAEDRRRHTVVVTAEGEAVREHVETIAFAVESRLQADSGLDDAEWEALIVLLQRLTHRGDVG